MSRQFLEQFPVINLGDFYLREIDIHDAPNYLQYMGSPEVKEFLSSENTPQNLAHAEKELLYWASLFKNGYSVYWAISNNEDEMIGTIGFNAIYRTHFRADVSYDLDPKYWGKGIMFRALKSIIAFAELELKIVRIQATVSTCNERSIKLLERTDFQKEGMLKKYEIVNGKYRDYFMYASVC